MTRYLFVLAVYARSPWPRRGTPQRGGPQLDRRPAVPVHHPVRDPRSVKVHRSANGTAMSWAAHEFENYLLQKKFSRHGWVTPSFLAIVIGTLVPGHVHEGVRPTSRPAATPPRSTAAGQASDSATRSSSVLCLAVVVLWLTRNRASGDRNGARTVRTRDHRHRRHGWCDALLSLLDRERDDRVMGVLGAQRPYGDGAAYYSGPWALWDLGWLLLTLLFAWRRSRPPTSARSSCRRMRPHGSGCDARSGSATTDCC